MRNFIFSFLALILLPAYMSGQVIKGKVTDSKGLGVVGAVVKATKSKTTTDVDFDGNFSIKAQVGENLQISMLGFESVTVPATASLMKITLQGSKDTKLDEVVVIGYGTAKKRDLTGSIVKVDGSAVADKPNSNAVASLQGKVAGLTIVNSGQLNSAPDVRIRGTSSLYNTKPYYIVNGLMMDNMDFVNPNDIESMEVLKDPSSLAIYGVRGANGIIIVTTKQAKKGNVSVAFNSSLGIKNITGTPKLTDASDFKSLFNEQLANDGLAPYQYYNFYKGNTNWIDTIKKNNANIINNNVTISSGTDTNTLQIGMGYSTEEGLIKNESYKKLTLSFNDVLKLNDNIKIGISANGTKANLPQTHDFSGALISTPILEPIDATTGLYNQLPPGLGDAQIGNPLATVDVFRNGTQINTQYKMVGNLFGEIKFLKDFTLRASYTGNFDDIKNREYNPVIDYFMPFSNSIYKNQNLTSVIESTTNNTNLLQEYLLTWNKKIGDHSITAMIGNTYNLESHKFNGAQGYQQSGGLAIPNDPRFWYLNANPYIVGNPKLLTGPEIKTNSGIGEITDKWNYLPWERGTTSYLFRALYNYQNKYLLNASFRRDGSSDLAATNRFQNFWAVGLGWELTREDFMKNVKGIDYLKLKGSYGQLGNLASPLHYMDKPFYIPGASGVFGNPQNVNPAYVVAYVSDPNLKWEKVNSYEVGFELETFNRRLRLESLYYTKTTKDLLLNLDAATIGTSYFTNSGEINNKGFEVVASWKDKINKDFSYSLSGNLTTIKNTVNSIYQDGYQYIDNNAITRAGSPIGSFYGYVVEGIYQSYADKINSVPSTLGSYGPGDFKFKDVNGDGVINEKDRTIIGNPTPDITYGVSLNLTYKNIYLDADLQGVYGNEIFRGWGNGSSYTNFNYRADRLARWNGAGTSNWEPRISTSSYNQLPSSYMIEDGSYVRLRNVQIGYKFNPASFSSIGIKSMKLFVNLQNLYTWKHNSGFSPELGGSPTSFGNDGGGYPIPSISTLGLNVTF